VAKTSSWDRGATRQRLAHDPQGFLSERDHLASVAPGPAHRGDARNARATADPQDDPTAGEHAERRGRLGEDRRWAQLQVCASCFVSSRRSAEGYRLRPKVIWCP
jgi:hypothetical protein